MTGAPGPETVINGRKYVYFGGTGYFALHGNAEIIRAGGDRALSLFRRVGA